MSGRTHRPNGALAPERCACGAMAAGICAVREEPVCPACAAVVGGEGE